MTQTTLDLVADIICPWCFIARRRVGQALTGLARDGLHIVPVWRPFLLYPDAPRSGFEQRAHLLRRFGTMDAADRYHDGVAEAGRAVGIDFRYDRIVVTPNTTDAHRLLLLAAASGRQWALADGLAQAFFSEGADLGDLAVLQRLAAAHGLDGEEARAMLAGDALRAEVHASDQAAKRAGLRGVPAFCMHGRILAIADLDDLPQALRSADRLLSRNATVGK